MARPKGSRNKPKGENAEPKKTKSKAKPKPRAASSTASSTAPAPSSEFRKPTADQVKALVKKMVSRGNEARTISQAASEVLAKAVETQHFDKKAFAIVKGLYQMSVNRPEALAITLPHLLAYIDDLGLAETAAEARGMDLEPEDDDTDLETETEQAEPDPGRPGMLRVVPGANAPVPSPGKDEEAA